MSIIETYEKFKHLDKFLSNPISDSPIYLTARDLWISIKQAAEQNVQPTVSPVDAQAQSDNNPSELDRPASGG